jgi:hypothetical protein
VILARHFGFAAELLHRFHNAFIIGSHNYVVDAFRKFGSFEYALDHRLSREQHQWFPGQPRGAIPRRNDYDYFGGTHRFLLSVYRE